MTKKEVISKIQDETLNIVKFSREKQIETYVELWEKYKKEIKE